MEPSMSAQYRPPVSVSQQLSFSVFSFCAFLLRLWPNISILQIFLSFFSFFFFSTDQIFPLKYFFPPLLPCWPNIFLLQIFPSVFSPKKGFPSPNIFFLFPFHFSSPPRKIFSFYKYFPLISDRIKDQLADVSRPFGLVKLFPFQDLVLSIFC